MISVEQNLGYEATIIPEIEDQSNVSGETINDNWDRELFALVAENAHVLVRCPWLQDSAVTLSEAMRAYPVPMTPENVVIVISDVYQLLSNRVMESEEPEEEEPAKTDEEPAKTEEVDQKSNTKTEVHKVQENSKTVDAQRLSKKEIDGTKYLEQFASREEKTSESEASNAIAAQAEVVANFDRSESKQSTQNVAKAEAAASPVNSPADTTNRNSLGAPETVTVTSSIPESSVLESVAGKNVQELRSMAHPVEDRFVETKPVVKSEIELQQQIPIFEVPEAVAAANPIVEAEPAAGGPESIADQEIEPLTLPVVIEATDEPEPAKISTLDLENPVVADDITELSGEKIEMAEDELALTTLDYQMDANSLTNFVEEKVLIDHHEEAGLEPDELYEFSNIPTLEIVENSLASGEDASTSQLGNESNPSGQMETSPEQHVQISLTIEEIEDTLIQLSERIEVNEPETTEKVNEILDKIIEVPAKLETYNGKNIITEAEAQEALEELFTELLDKTSIGYTPKLIESLACLTLKWHLVDEIEKLKNEEETDKAPPGSGTHEIIKKLLAGLSTIKKAIAHACAIGKSALQLYTFNFAT